MNIKKVAPALIPEPAGLVKQIQAIQVELYEALPWLINSYGIATTGGTKDGKPARVPEVYVGGNRYIPVTINDRFSAHSFFKLEGPSRYPNYVPNIRNSVEQQVSWIVLMNLDQIREDMSFDYDHRFTEELKREILHAFKAIPAIRLQQIAEDPRAVFEGYTYAQTEEQTFRHPFAGFKFTFGIGFLEDC